MTDYYKKVLQLLILAVSLFGINCFAQEQILQITVGVDSWMHISIRNGYLKFHGDKNSVSSHSDLKRWKGFFADKPTAMISVSGNTPKIWKMQKDFSLKRFFANSSEYNIKSVMLLSSGRSDFSIHSDPVDVNRIPQTDIKKNNFIVWNKNNIKIYDNDHGSSPYIIKITLSFKRDFKLPEPFISKTHKFLPPHPRIDPISLDRLVFDRKINLAVLSRKNINKLPKKEWKQLFDFQDEEKLYSQYWGVSKHRLIADKFYLLQEPLLEVAANYTRTGNLRSMDLIIYSVDESNQLSSEQFKKLSNKVYNKICSKLGPCTQRNNFSAENKQDSTRGNIWQWNCGDKSVELNVRSDRHIYVRIAPLKKLKRSPQHIASNNLNNIKKIKKTVLIEHIPMVNQGGKGYCVPATFSAVLLYMGFEINQYALAATDIKEFINEAQLPLIFYRVNMPVPPREYIVKKYNRKKASRYANLTAKELYEKFEKIKKETDIQLLYKICSENKRFHEFKKNLIKYINKGVPICWGISGHVAMIIGYDLSKNEIIYRDSWGKNHLKTRKNIFEAFLISNEFLIIEPKQCLLQ